MNFNYKILILMAWMVIQLSNAKAQDSLRLTQLMQQAEGILQPSELESRNCQAIFSNIDGRFHNCNNPWWGSAGQPFSRITPAAYSDGRSGLAGSRRANPRAISNSLSAQNTAKFNEKGLSAFVFAWGQFIDHDISVTEEGGERANITLPNNEPLFRMPISFSRSKPRDGTGVNSPREQTNKITAWIDASMVYGSDTHRANWLRTFRNGKLKVSSGNLLPFNTTNGQQSGAVDPNAPQMAGSNRGKVFVAGDERANEQPTLMALHTLFVREHNRLCDYYVSLGYTNDENNYQLARKIVTAHIQAITFYEFLPALGIELEEYEGCHQNLNPNTLHEFASAGFRIGHTMVNPSLRLVDNNNRTTGNISLVEGFFNTNFVKDRGIDQVLMGMSRDRQQEIDLLVINDLRNFLFTPQPGSPGTDLVSINIQRGRDHGLADYNTVRKTFTGSRANTWSDITKNRTVQDKLRQLYPNVNDIDLWVGALAEDKLPWASVGITHYAILWIQFTILRDGDRFYFENDPLFVDNYDWIDYFFETSLGDLIQFNTGLSNIGWDVFFVPFDKNNNSDENNMFANEKAKDRTINHLDPETVNLVFPNPTSGVFSIKHADQFNSMKVIDLQGRVQFQAYQVVLEEYDFSHLPSGVYWIQLTNEEQNISKKLVIQNAN